MISLPKEPEEDIGATIATGKWGRDPGKGIAREGEHQLLNINSAKTLAWGRLKAAQTELTGIWVATQETEFAVNC